MRALRKVTALLLSALLVFATASMVSAQGGMSVTQVDGLNAAGKIEDGATLIFHLQMVNPHDVEIAGIDNGYWFKSDGMTWAGISGTWNDDVCWVEGSGPCGNDWLFDMGPFTTIVGDTIGFGAASVISGTGLPIEFDEPGYTIEIGPISVNGGTYLTIDSCFVPPASHWEWSASLVGVVDCDWSGPHTYSADIPCVPPAITTTTLPDGEEGTAYATTVAATGDPTLAFSLVAPPTGMVINGSSGEITWPLPVAGTYSVEVYVSDECGDDTETFSLYICDPPAITSSPVLAATVNSPYSYDVEATGDGTLIYALGGTIPAGMNIVTSTGLITWLPAIEDSYPIRVEVTGDCGTAIQEFTIVVSAACVPPTILTTELPGGEVGVPYSTFVAATGDPTLVFDLTEAPGDMDINPSTGEITWNPAAAGFFDVTVEVSNGCYPAASEDFVVEVVEGCVPPTITTTELPGATVDEAYSTFVAATGDPVLAFALTTNPDGMVINGTTGEITWTPDAVGTFNVTVEVSNGCDPAASEDFTVEVTEPITDPYCTFDPEELYLKNLPDDRTVRVSIHDPLYANIDKASVRIQGKIPCYSNDGVAYEDPLDPTVVVSDAFVFRFLSAWRPIREDDMPNEEAAYSVTYSYDFPSDPVTLHGTFTLDWALLLTDLNQDGKADQKDIDLLGSYLWKQGPAAPWEELMDVDQNGQVSSGDMIKLRDMIE